MKSLLKLLILSLLFSIGCTAGKHTAKVKTTDRTRSDISATTRTNSAASVATDSSRTTLQQSHVVTTLTTGDDSIIIEERFVPIRLPTGEVTPILSNRTTRSRSHRSQSIKDSAHQSATHQAAIKTAASAKSTATTLSDKSKYNRQEASTVKEEPPNYLGIGIGIIIVVLLAVFFLSKKFLP